MRFFYLQTPYFYAKNHSIHIVQKKMSFFPNPTVNVFPKNATTTIGNIPTNSFIYQNFKSHFLMNNFNKTSNFSPNKKNANIYYFVIFLFITPQYIHSQCPVHNIGTFDITGNFAETGFKIGQTFTACQTGNITSISLGFGSGLVASTNNNLRIQAITPPLSSTLSSTAHQTFNLTSGAQTVVITLNSPFPVVAGNDYAFEIENSAGTSWDLQMNSIDDYTDGYLYQHTNGSFNDFGQAADLDFEVNIQPSSSNPEVPTLSEWGLIILALLLMTLGALYLVQPRFRSSLEQER